MVALNKTYRKTLTPYRSAQDSGHRFYSPEISRWLSRDPIGEISFSSKYWNHFIRQSCGGPDGADIACHDISVNRFESWKRQSQLLVYSHAQNSPVNNIDPIGLRCIITLMLGHTGWVTARIPEENPAPCDRWGPLTCRTRDMIIGQREQWGPYNTWLITGWPLIRGRIHTYDSDEYRNNPEPGDVLITDFAGSLERLVLEEAERVCRQCCCARFTVDVQCESDSHPSHLTNVWGREGYRPSCGVRTYVCLQGLEMPTSLQ